MLKTRNRHKIIWLGVLLIVMLHSLGRAQENNGYNFYAGGGLGLQFGTITLIDISPHAAYQANPNLSAGVGLSYQYYKDSRFQESFSTDVFGVRAFVRQDIYKNVFADFEYEILNYEHYDWSDNETQRITAYNYLLGGGYRQSLGERTFLNIILLWNLNETDQSLYISPISRIEINFRF